MEWGGGPLLACGDTHADSASRRPYSASGIGESEGVDLPFVVVYCAVLVARRTLSGSCFTASCNVMVFRPQH